MTQEDMAEKATRRNAWPIRTFDGLSLIQSPVLASAGGVLHAFTTRQGGNTPPPMDSFNLGRHVAREEAIEDAMRNRKLLCQAIGLDSRMLTVPGQQHTSNVFWLDDQEHVGTRLSNFDAVATTRTGWPVLLHFADCVPVILFDRAKRALCIVHAGWRGTAGSIARRAVSVLCEQAGSKPADLIAAIGPAIGSCCYETGDEVVEALSATVRDVSPFVERMHGKPRPDLKGINALQLLECGVEEVDVTDWCTACHPQIFYSHRQSGGQTGRQGALACMM